MSSKCIFWGVSFSASTQKLGSLFCPEKFVIKLHWNPRRADFMFKTKLRSVAPIMITIIIITLQTTHTVLKAFLFLNLSLAEGQTSCPQASWKWLRQRRGDYQLGEQKSEGTIAHQDHDQSSRDQGVRGCEMPVFLAPPVPRLALSSAGTGGRSPGHRQHLCASSEQPSKGWSSGSATPACPKRMLSVSKEGIFRLSAGYWSHVERFYGGAERELTWWIAWDVWAQCWHLTVKTLINVYNCHPEGRGRYSPYLKYCNPPYQHKCVFQHPCLVHQRTRFTADD